MLCSADIFGHVTDFCTTFVFLSCCTLQRVDDLFRINELVIWELVKCDSISNYRKYFAFSSSQYAYNTAHLFPSSFLLSQSPPSPWKTLPRIQTQPTTNHPLFSNRKFPLALNGKTEVREWLRGRKRDLEYRRHKEVFSFIPVWSI